jgi:flavin-dependent dehydrogenase
MKAQVVIAGGGPAGLAAAIHLARRGLDVALCEQRQGPPDKACGEGLMPGGVRALAGLGILEDLDPGDYHPFRQIHLIQEDDSEVSGRLPRPGGLGIRRTALTAALAHAAAAAGARLLWGRRVRGHRLTPAGMQVETDAGTFEAELLVAADGLHSPLRRAAGLDVQASGRRRFGLRRHFRLTPRGPWVEVHLAPAAEAFVTPAGPGRTGVAFLWDRARIAGPVRFETLLGLFPRLEGRLATAAADSSPLGAGPLEQASTARIQNRFVLLGDAAGYVDAITGEGISLALAAAAVLGDIAPGALAMGASRESLLPYARVCDRSFRRYARATRAVLMVARRPRLRRTAVRGLSRYPVLLNRLLAHL